MKTAVFVIDMLKSFVDEELKELYVPGSKGIVDDITRFLDEARNNNIPVFYLNDAHDEDDKEFNIYPKHAVKGTAGAEIIEKLKPKQGDYVIKKTRFSAFYKTNLEEKLNELGIERVVITGVCTEICAFSTAADAKNRDYNVVFVNDLTKALSDENYEAAMRIIPLYGIDVINKEKAREVIFK